MAPKDFNSRFSFLTSDKEKQPQTDDVSAASENVAPVSTNHGANHNSEKTSHNLYSNSDLPDNIAKDVNKYIYGKDGKDNRTYTDAVADYIDAEGLPEDKKTEQILALIKHLQKEFAKRPDKSQPRSPRIFRPHLLNLAMELERFRDVEIAKEVKALMLSVSKVSAGDYVRRGKDSFLTNLQEAHNKTHKKDDTKFLDEISAAHVEHVLNKIAKQTDKTAEEIQAQKEIYLQFLRKNGFERYVPFEPSAVQIAACEYAKINWKEFKKEADLMQAISDKGLVIAGNKVFVKGMEDDAPVAVVEDENTKKETEAADNDNLSPDDLPSAAKNTLNIDVLPTEENPSQNQPQTFAPWVQDKINEYDEMLAAKKIQSFENISNENEFIALVNEDKIHYKDKDNVSVAANAKIETFEAILAEKDNLGRAVNFAENMPHETAVLLAAACIMHGNQMQGNVPQLTAEDMRLLQDKLGERYGEFANKQQQSLMSNNTATDNKNEVTAENNNEEPNTGNAQKIREIRKRIATEQKPDKNTIQARNRNPESAARIQKVVAAQQQNTK